MGAWGVGPFENDDAGDFETDLKDSDDVSAELRGAMSAAANSEGELDASDACFAIAAAAVVAVTAGGTPADIADEDREWIAALLIDDDALANLAPIATAALDRVRGQDSESLKLWEDAGQADVFLRSVEGIRAGLPRPA